MNYDLMRYQRIDNTLLDTNVIDLFIVYATLLYKYDQIF